MKNIIRKVFLLGVFWGLAAATAFSQTYRFDFTEGCGAAYDKIMSFQLDEGATMLQQELAQDPYNLIPVYLENYEDFVVLMFNGDSREYDKRKKNLDTRISKISKNGSNKSPWFNFSKANIYLQWATIKIRFGDYVSAANDFRKSYSLIRQNAEKFPDFKYNNIVYGLEEAIMGSVPDKHKWMVSVLGMKGDVTKGTTKVVNFLNVRDESTKYLRAEAILYYCYLKFTLLSDKEATWTYLQRSALDYKNNLLFAFLKSNIALSMNKAADAESVLKHVNRSSKYLEVPLLDYYLGVAYFYNNNAACITQFEKFLDNYSGRLFVKDAYQKMSIYSFVNDDHTGYENYKSRILEYGNTLIESDKQAERFAKSNASLHKELLLARMYSDGGYAPKSLMVLNGISAAALEEKAHELEYYYRYAKVYMLQHKTNSAIPYYKKTIELGANREEHYAARSCLELGEIYEDRGQKTTAKSYYQKCLNMQNHDYKSALDQKAKAAINRLSN